MRKETAYIFDTTTQPLNRLPCVESSVCELKVKQKPNALVLS